MEEDQQQHTHPRPNKRKFKDITGSPTTEPNIPPENLPQNMTNRRRNLIKVMRTAKQFRPASAFDVGPAVQVPQPDTSSPEEKITGTEGMITTPTIEGDIYFGYRIRYPSSIQVFKCLFQTERNK